jgi:serine/threonine protein kinase
MKLTRRQLESLPRETLHQARNWSKADVSVAEWPPASGRRVVIKDLKRRPLWFRVIAGRYFLRREWRALCVFKDVSEVPTPIARPDADCLVIEHKAGRQLETIAPAEMPEGVSEKIERLMQRIHQRGVTHGDLHSYNILVDESGEVTLIDWATACVFGAQPAGVKKFAFEEWRALDERALAKIKIVYALSELTARERDLILNGGSRIYRFVKKFKNSLEKIRGVDEERRASRAAKQEMYLSRLGARSPGCENTLPESAESGECETPPSSQNVAATELGQQGLYSTSSFSKNHD